MNHAALKLTVACLPILVACAGRSGTTRPLVEARVPGVVVEVQNQNFYSATIYAYRAGSRRRLGEVGSNQTTDFDFKWPNSEVRFLIDFQATGCIITASLPVDDDDNLLLILQVDDHRRALQDVCRR